jgi:hypothetical protein
MTTDTLVHFLLFAAGLSSGIVINVADRLYRNAKAKPLPYEIRGDVRPPIVIRASTPPPILVDLSSVPFEDNQRAA